jgi:hypothetical protein
MKRLRKLKKANKPAPPRLKVVKTGVRAGHALWNKRAVAWG